MSTEQSNPNSTVMADLSAFQRDLLTVIAGLDAPKGLTIKGVLEEQYGESVSHGRIYPNLDKLADKGLVEIGSKDRRTNEYRITARGKLILDGHCAWIRTQLAHAGP